jgi:hypothetical protein
MHSICSLTTADAPKAELAKRDHAVAYHQGTRRLYHRQWVRRAAYSTVALGKQANLKVVVNLESGPEYVVRAALVETELDEHVCIEMDRDIQNLTLLEHNSAIHPGDASLQWQIANIALGF